MQKCKQWRPQSSPHTVLEHCGKMGSTIYFKVVRIEHIFALSLQVVDIECIAYEFLKQTTDPGYCTGRCFSIGNRGRPRYDVQETNLQSAVVVRPWKLRKWCQSSGYCNYGISLSYITFCPTSYSELDQIISNIKGAFPGSGYCVTLGILCSGVTCEIFLCKELV